MARDGDHGGATWLGASHDACVRSALERDGEAFVHTLRRDYLAGADLSSAAAAFRQLPAWQDDCNGIAPHSALGYRAPQEHRAARAAEVG
jgi:hypothetical protein